MSLKYETRPETQLHEEAPHASAARRAWEWVLGIVGAVAVFLGSFIFLAGENQSLGFGGDWSWRVGDIDAVWGYGFLAGGAVLILAVVAMLVQEYRRS